MLSHSECRYHNRKCRQASKMTEARSMLLSDEVQQSSSECQLLRDDKGSLCFLFLWLFTFMIYARPEDMFPALESLILTLAFGSCSLLMWFGRHVLGHSRLP